MNFDDSEMSAFALNIPISSTPVTTTISVEQPKALQWDDEAVMKSLANAVGFEEGKSGQDLTFVPVLTDAKVDDEQNEMMMDNAEMEDELRQQQQLFHQQQRQQQQRQQQQAVALPDWEPAALPMPPWALQQPPSADEVASFVPEDKEGQALLVAEYARGVEEGQRVAMEQAEEEMDSGGKRTRIN